MIFQYFNILKEFESAAVMSKPRITSRIRCHRRVLRYSLIPDGFLTKNRPFNSCACTLLLVIFEILRLGSFA